MEVETEKYPTHILTDGLSFHRTTRLRSRALARTYTYIYTRERVPCVHAYLYVGDVTKSSLAANAFAEGDPWRRERKGGGASAVSMEREESMAKSRRWIRRRRCAERSAEKRYGRC